VHSFISFWFCLVLFGTQENVDLRGIVSCKRQDERKLVSLTKYTPLNQVVDFFDTITFWHNVVAHITQKQHTKRYSSTEFAPTKCVDNLICNPC